MDKKRGYLQIKNVAVVFLALNIILTYKTQNAYLFLSGFYSWILPSIVLGLTVIARNRIKINYGFVCSMILLILTIFGGVAAGYNISTGVFFSYSLIFIELVIFFLMDLNSRHILFLLNSIKYSAIIFSILMFFTRIDYWGGGWRYSVKVGKGPIIDPNYLGFAFSSGFAVSLYMIAISKKNVKRRMVNVVYGFINLVSTFFTGSRAAMVAALCAIIFFGIQLMFDQGRSKSAIIRNVLCMVIFMVGVIYIIYHLPQNIFNRLFAFSYHDSSNSRRIYLWNNAFQEIKNRRFIFGIGCIEEVDAIGTPVHNTFLSIWLAFGIAGITSLAYMIIRSVSSLLKKRNFVMLGILVQTLFCSCCIGCSFVLIFWVVIMLCCLDGITLAPNIEKKG